MKKFALVCGASGGIGQKVCEKLATEGWSLYLHYFRNGDAVCHMLAEFSNRYKDQEFIPVYSDFSAADGGDKLAAQIFSLQAIVFANGHAYYSLLEDTPVIEMEKLWRVHMQNPVRLLANLSKKLRANKTSYVLFIGSIWGAAGAAGETVYSAVKGAQHSFVKAYAQEVAYNGIRVNAIAPGFIDTNMNQQLTLQEKNSIAEEIPLQALGQAADIANMIAFYLSGQADYVTGQIIHVNGGWYI